MPWIYRGDMKCPCHNQYSIVHTNGWRQNTVMRLKCKLTGERWLKTFFTPWIKMKLVGERSDIINASTKTMNELMANAKRG